MARIKNHKPIIIFLTLLLPLISIAVLFAPNMRPIKRVRVHNKNIVISQGNTSLYSSNIGLNNSSTVQNQDITSLNKELGINNQDVNFRNNNSNVASGEINNWDIHYNNTTIKSDNRIVGNFGGKIGTNQVGVDFQNNPRYKQAMEKYRYQDINWGTWKSRFVNKILDDSLYLKSLDNYGLGTWFYYSFTVANTGEIHDVFVFSFYLLEEDKNRIRALIRGYEKTPITIFPKNSERRTVRVKAIMLLGDTEQKAKPSNFGDRERVKIRY